MDFLAKHDEADTIATDAVLTQAIAEWNSKSPARDAAATAFQQQKQTLEAQMRAIAHERENLTAVINTYDARRQTYAFDKNASNFATAPTRGRYDPQNPGAIDYMAAADIDAAFKQECRARAAFADRHLIRLTSGDGKLIGSTSYTTRQDYTGDSLAAAFDAHNGMTGVAAPDLDARIGWLDKIRGTLDSVFVASPPLHKAERRLQHELKTRFDALMADPVTRAKIDANRDAQAAAYLAAIDQIPALDCRADALKQSLAAAERSAMGPADRDAKILESVAFLQAAGVTTIACARNTSLSDALARATAQYDGMASDRSPHLSATAQEKAARVLGQRGLRRPTRILSGFIPA